MTHYHAVMIDETGCEFGAGVHASSYEEARSKLEEDYPESRIAQIENPNDTAERQQRIYADALAGIDYDEEGRPFYAHGAPEWDDEDFEEDFEDDLEPLPTLHLL